MAVKTEFVNVDVDTVDVVGSCSVQVQYSLTRVAAAACRT